jgi:hypothetical protein
MGNNQFSMPNPQSRRADEDWILDIGYWILDIEYWLLRGTSLEGRGRQANGVAREWGIGSHGK